MFRSYGLNHLAAGFPAHQSMMPTSQIPQMQFSRFLQNPSSQNALFSRFGNPSRSMGNFRGAIRSFGDFGNDLTGGLFGGGSVTGHAYNPNATGQFGAVQPVRGHGFLSGGIGSMMSDFAHQYAQHPVQNQPYHFDLANAHRFLHI